MRRIQLWAEVLLATILSKKSCFADDWIPRKCIQWRWRRCQKDKVCRQIGKQSENAFCFLLKTRGLQTSEIESNQSFNLRYACNYLVHLGCIAYASKSMSWPIIFQGRWCTNQIKGKNWRTSSFRNQNYILNQMLFLLTLLHWNN